MLKKLLIVSTALTLSSGLAFASGAPYIGASFGEVTNTTDTLNRNFRAYR